MKKLIIVLMVVAVASFLFVGCLPDAVTPAVTPTEPTEPVVAKTEAPYITQIGAAQAKISLSSTDTQYTNSPGAVGVGVAGAVIKIYINDVWTGVGNTGASGDFTSIGITMATVADGAKTLYATATQPGLAESDPSDSYTFTYDTVEPAIVSAVADSSANTITVTFDGPVETGTTGSTYYTTSAMNSTLWTGEMPVGVAITNMTMSETSETVVVITPTPAVSSAADLGDPFTITLAAAVVDKAGNDNAVATTYVGLVAP